MPVSNQIAATLLSLALVVQAAASGTSAALASGRMGTCMTVGGAPCHENPCEGMPECGGTGPSASCARACSSHAITYIASTGPVLVPCEAIVFEQTPRVVTSSFSFSLARSADPLSRGRPALYLSDHAFLI